MPAWAFLGAAWDDMGGVGSQHFPRNDRHRARVDDVARGARRRTTLLSGAVVAVAAGAWAVATVRGGGSPPPVPVGLPDAGPLVAWGSRVGGLLTLLVSVVAVGSLMVVAAGAATTEVRRRAAGSARTWLRWWAALLVVGAVLGEAEALGVSLGALDAAHLVDLATRTPPMLLAQLAVLLGAAWLLRRATTTATRALWLAPVVGVAVVSSLRGHPATGDAMAVGGLVVHVTAALLWTGGLVGLLLHLRTQPRSLALGVPRYSRLALGCYLVLATSGVLGAALVLADSPRPWSSGYAGIVAAKAAVLVLAGACGVAHRRRSLPAVQAGRTRGFIRLAAGELCLMAAGAGLAAALARTPLPATPGRSGPAHGHPGSAAALPDLTWSALWTQARPNPVVVVVLAVTLAWYLSAAAAVRRTGGTWPARRSVLVVAATGLGLAATCSGSATYAHLRPSLFVAQLLLVMLVVPALALASRPWLLLRGQAAERVVPPPLGSLLVCGLLLAVQHTPVVATAFRSDWWHLALLVVAAGCGTLLWWPLLGPGEDGPTGWLLPVAVALAVLAARLGLGRDLLAPEWFLQVRLLGADPFADQRTAALVTTAAAAGLVLAAVVLAVRRPSYPAPTGPGGQSPVSTVPRSSAAPIAP